MDRLDAMSAFVAVAELHGFTPAAKRLGLSPSAITRLVAALEEHLELRLLQRTTRSVTLTDAGARYLESARRILSAVEDAEGAARAERTEPRGRFVVSAPNVFGRRELAPLMSEFLRAFPAVRGELLLADRMVHLIEEGVDLALRIGVLDDSSLRARVVGRTRMMVVASPHYLAAHKRIRSPADLRGHALVQFTSLCPVPEWRFVRDGEEERVPFAPVFVTNSADAAIGHVESGGGLTRVLSYQVADAIRAGTLAVVLPKFEPSALPIQLVHPSARLVSANVKAFVAMAVATRSWDFLAP